MGERSESIQASISPLSTKYANEGKTSVNVSIGQYGRSMVLYFVTGALGSLVCMKAAEVTEKWLPVFAKPLSFIGRHTMPILCWHLFVIEIIKKVFLILGM